MGYLNMIHRPSYLQKLEKFRGKRLIKILTGIRRCGKSTLLRLFREHLLQNGRKKDRFISYNFEDASLRDMMQWEKLHDTIVSQLNPHRMNYIFLDEIQLIPQFERTLDSLYIRDNTDLYITGSNAYMLSGELATLLSGRYVEIHVQPLSFAEFVSVQPDSGNLSRYYRDYVQFGAFPYVQELAKDEESIRDYLGGIYNTVLLKDVAMRRKSTETALLERLTRFLFDNIGGLVSTKKISDTLTSDGTKTSCHTVDGYLSALTNCYLLYQANRFDIAGKQYLKTGSKYYLSDMGLRTYLLGYRSGDAGRILENVIYLELKRRGYQVFIGKTGTREVDFVAQRGGETEYYQVAATVRDEATLKRELLSLETIPDNHPKYLLTLDDDPPSSHNGIRQMNALDFLCATH